MPDSVAVGLALLFGALALFFLLVGVFNSLHPRVAFPVAKMIQISLAIAASGGASYYFYTQL